MEQQPLYQSNFRQENQFSLKNRKNFISSNLLLIIAQIIVWGFLIYTFIEHDFYPAFMFAYVIYLIIGFCSYTSRFLLNKKSANSIYSKLKEIFISNPVLQLSISCYHYETRYETKRNREGQVYDEEITEKVETYRERKDFPYYSFRDISGLFKIDLDNEIFRNKTYIKLTLDTVISFADSISYYDYQIFKNHFIDENKNKDAKFDFKENFYISNLSKNNLIRIKDEEPFYVNFFFFFLCTIFTFALPYEIMLDIISLDGIYQIKKIISTRYNLNSYEYDGMYANSVPAIKLGNNTFNFTSEDYGYHDQNAYVNLPTMEEIERAKQYEEEIKRPIYNDHSMDENNNYDYPSKEDLERQSKKFY